MYNETVLEKFKNEVAQTVEQVVDELKSDSERLLELAKSDSIRSVAYYEAYKRMVKKFEDNVMKHKYPQIEDPLWGYTYRFDGFSLSLILANHEYNEYEIEGVEYRDFTIVDYFELIKVEPEYLTIEEYARQYGVDSKTVTQWIRRGKIRTAAKYGNVWMIPELTDAPKRGYIPAKYEIVGNVRPLTDEYKFLEQAGKISITQNDDEKGMFTVNVYKGGPLREESIFPYYSECYTTKEKEKFEIALIAHPNIKYCIEYREGYLDDYIRIKEED